MAVDVETYAVAKKYTDKSLAGGGAVKGKNCTIDSITAITGGNRVTFKWTLDDGTEQTSTMDVMNGEKGDDGDRGPAGQDGSDGANGISITDASLDANGHLILTYSNSETEDVGKVTGENTVVWSQLVNTGTKIATVTINGTTTNVYAPSASNPWKEVTGTLTAGQTSITISSNYITTSSTIDVYTSADIEYNTMTISSGQVVLTFDAQQSNITVKVRVS